MFFALVELYLNRNESVESLGKCRLCHSAILHFHKIYNCRTALGKRFLYRTGFSLEKLFLGWLHFQSRDNHQGTKMNKTVLLRFVKDHDIFVVKLLWSVKCTNVNTNSTVLILAWNKLDSIAKLSFFMKFLFHFHLFTSILQVFKPALIFVPSAPFFLWGQLLLRSDIMRLAGILARF